MAIDKYIAALGSGASVEEFGVKELPEPVVAPVVKKTTKTKSASAAAKTSVGRRVAAK